jgi:hypothetical protein
MTSFAEQSQQTPAIRDGVQPISRHISAKRKRGKNNSPNSQGKVTGSMGRIYGESSFKDVYGCDCTSVHKKKLIK